MALQLNRVAYSSPTEPRPLGARFTASGTLGGRPTAQPATSAKASQADPNFRALLARSAATNRLAAPIACAAGTVAIAGAESPASSPKGASGLSDVGLWIGRDSKPVVTPVTGAVTSSTNSTSAAGASTSSPTALANGLSDFELAFGGSSYNPADPLAASRNAAANSAKAALAVAPPTPQSVFGPNVWMTDPTGLNPDGTTFGYNPLYFATESTAQTVAKMIGGTVVAKDMITTAGGPFVQQQPNYMVQMPDGALINPGLVASFYTFGFPQSQIDTMIAQEVANTPPPAQTT